MWVGGSVAAVKPLQAVLPAKKIPLTLLPASPGLFLDFFVWTSSLSYGTIRQKERWTSMVSCGRERVNNILIFFFPIRRQSLGLTVMSGAHTPTA